MINRDREIKGNISSDFCRGTIGTLSDNEQSQIGCFSFFTKASRSSSVRMYLRVAVIGTCLLFASMQVNVD